MEEMKEQKKQDKTKGKINWILIALVVIIIGCLIYIAGYFIKQSRNSKIYEELETEVRTTQSVSTEQVVTETQTQAEEPVVIPIDFAQLEDLNPDIYAWIEIPDTQLAYPILRSEAMDDYYLDITVEGNSGLPGSIYTQASVNNKEFTDFNTIVYGHDMKNGSMFGTLKQYREDLNYWKEHPEIIVYTPDQKLVYRVFAAVVYSDDLIPYKYDLNSNQGRQEFLDSIYNNTDSRTLIDKEIKVDTNSRLITLSTCIGSEKEHRFLVIGVLE